MCIVRYVIRSVRCVYIIPNAQISEPEGSRLLTSKRTSSFVSVFHLLCLRDLSYCFSVNSSSDCKVDCEISGSTATGMKMTCLLECCAV
jgi:molybdenum cofactor biosynthesis enzyme